MILRDKELHDLNSVVYTLRNAGSFLPLFGRVSTYDGGTELCNMILGAQVNPHILLLALTFALAHIASS